MSNSRKRGEANPRSSSGSEEEKSNSPLTRLLIRNLPPYLTEKDFLEIFKPLPEHNEFYFVEADWSLESKSTSRAYINLVNASDAFDFRKCFNGLVVTDSSGKVGVALIEYAPSQGLRKLKTSKPAPDPLCGTIEQNSSYQKFLHKFLEEQKADVIPKANAFNMLDVYERKPKETTTPLLEYVNAENRKRDIERGAGCSSWSRNRGYCYHYGYNDGRRSDYVSNSSIGGNRLHDDSAEGGMLGLFDLNWSTFYSAHSGSGNVKANNLSGRDGGREAVRVSRKQDDVPSCSRKSGHKDVRNVRHNHTHYERFEDSNDEDYFESPNSNFYIGHGCGRKSHQGPVRLYNCTDGRSKSNRGRGGSRKSGHRGGYGEENDVYVNGNFAAGRGRGGFAGVVRGRQCGNGRPKKFNRTKDCIGGSRNGARGQNR